MIGWMWAFLDRPTATFGDCVRFWSTVTGSTVSAPRGEHDEFVTLLPATGTPWIKMQAVGDDGGIHLDLDVDDIPAAVDTVIALGGRLISDRGYAIMESPAGQTFCLTPLHRAQEPGAHGPPRVTSHPHAAAGPGAPAEGGLTHSSASPDSPSTALSADPTPTPPDPGSTPTTITPDPTRALPDPGSTPTALVRDSTDALPEPGSAPAPSNERTASARPGHAARVDGIRPLIAEPFLAPDGTASRLDQICLDLSADRLDGDRDFWSALTGWPATAGALPEFTRVRPDSAFPFDLLIQRLGTPRRAGAHPDLSSTDIAATAAWHESLGATRVSDGERWIVLRDPGDAPYCVTSRDPYRTAPRHQERPTGSDHTRSR